MEKNWFVIINPQSGGGKALRLWKEAAILMEKENIPFTPVFTRAPQHAIQLVAEGISQGFRHFIAVGGDGTISEVVNGIFTQKVVSSQEILLAVFPAGTGNDWARFYKIPSKVRELIKLIQTEKARIQDIGKITYQENSERKIRFFNNVAGMGFEAFVTEKTKDVNKAGFWGQAGYLMGVLTNLFKFESPELSVQAGDFSYKKTCLLLTIGLCRYNGNGMNLVPLSIPDDQLFDLTLIEKISPWNVLRHILKIYNGRIYRHPKAVHYRAAEVYIQSNSPAYIEADGEVLGEVPIRVELIPEALKIVVPS